MFQNVDLGVGRDDKKGGNISIGHPHSLFPEYWGMSVTELYQHSYVH